MNRTHAANIQMVLLSTQTAWSLWMSCTFVSLPQIQLGFCCFSTKLKEIWGNTPSCELPVFVSPQAIDKGMCLFEKSTAALPWKRLLVILYSLSTQHNKTVQLPPSLPWASAPISTISIFFSPHIFPLSFLFQPPHCENSFHHSSCFSDACVLLGSVKIKLKY